MGIEFSLLGDVEVRIEGEVVDIGHIRQLSVLLALLVDANRVVSADQLTDRVWGEQPPPTARGTLSAYLTRLRKALSPAQDVTITRRLGGYVLTVAPETVDVHRFRRLIHQAHDADDDHAAVALDQALGLWRGEAFAHLDTAWLATVRESLNRERLAAQLDRNDLHLRYGDHARLLPDLVVQAGEHPLDERLAGQLMLALYRAGRAADALDHYGQVRALLAEELGTDPGPALRELHHQILITDPALLDVPSRAQARPVVVPRQLPAPPAPFVVRGAELDRLEVPRQLPAGLQDFVGRGVTFEQIVGLLSGDGGTGVPVVAISGQPGVGKSALAVQVAHHLRAQFPDGQLFIDLLGNTLDRALTAEQVLARFLQSLSLSPAQLPDDLNGLVSAYRTALADRKVLVVLDNAASPGQVRNLLPSTPGSAALVTSRKSLRGLAALGGARLVNLEVLGPEHSVALLNTIIGHDRRHDLAALDEIAELCGHLPLALRIAGANLLLRDDDSARGYVTDLRHGNRLSVLEIEDDPGATVRAVFDLSYLALKPEVARLFRQLGLVPGPDFSLQAVAVLAQLPAERARKLLAELVDAGLIQQTASDRFRFHDLLRLYSEERCQIEEDSTEADAARARLFAYYVRWLDAVADVLWETWVRLPRTEVELVVSSPTFDDTAPAFAWMDQEGLNVIAAVIDATERGPVLAAWHLVESLCAYLVTRGRYRAEGLVAAKAALNAAKAAGDAHAEATMHYVHASLYHRVQERGTAMAHTLAQLDAYDRCESYDGRARALISLGILFQADGKLRAAAEQVERGVRLAEEHGLNKVRLFGLINLSVIERKRGHLDRAEWSAREALTVAPASGTFMTVASSRTVLGEVMIRRGRFREAIDQYAAALACYRETGTRYYEARTLRALADANRLAGDHKAALVRAHEALAIAEKSGIDQDQVDSLVTLAAAHQGMAHPDEAATCARNALEMSRGLGYQRGEISALLELASQCRQRGDLTTAREHARDAAELGRHAELVELEGQSETLLAWLAFDVQDLIAARDHAQRALAAHTNAGSRFGQARALHVLGSALDACSDSEQARSCWEQALDCLAGLDIPDTDELRRLLAASPRSWSKTAENVACPGRESGQ
ncbi:BTAD domain-containing putative transcriptional regulator [Kutzneria buriramensis]|uniref:DNA-binding SARP family transcriptional activator n=1 Tax=Kutzneria buriramensis TaxID=1045776 RepID=A0A3E0GZH6_9PSEU|nr:BTAD domain-containing putative transcriptional regulator [Kutzneria buriramensis]REH35754.1 DNA-binding SARP family transcriptional activator [Kutzneria buriramensis]